MQIKETDTKPTSDKEIWSNSEQRMIRIALRQVFGDRRDTVFGEAMELFIAVHEKNLNKAEPSRKMREVWDRMSQFPTVFQERDLEELRDYLQKNGVTNWFKRMENAIVLQKNKGETEEKIEQALAGTLGCKMWEEVKTGLLAWKEELEEKRRSYDERIEYAVCNPRCGSARGELTGSCIDDRVRPYEYSVNLWGWDRLVEVCGVTREELQRKMREDTRDPEAWFLWENAEVIIRKSRQKALKMGSVRAIPKNQIRTRADAMRRCLELRYIPRDKWPENDGGSTGMGPCG